MPLLPLSLVELEILAGLVCKLSTMEGVKKLSGIIGIINNYQEVVHNSLGFPFHIYK